MGEEVIDLTGRARSCTENPLVRLQKRLKSMGSGDRIIIYTDPAVVPIEVVEIMASKYGAAVKVLKTDKGLIEAKITKK